MPRVLDDYGWVMDRFADAREVDGGRYVNARCPLGPHDHARDKLRFWVRNGNLCFTCWGGCPKLEVLRSVGAGWADCFPGRVLPDRPRQQVTARYPYRDEAGALLYMTERLEPGRGGRDKEFRQKQPDPTRTGGWRFDLDGVRRVLYRLPELLAAPPERVVWVVSGEKDADSLAKLGLVSTTNVCGERSPWLDEYSRCLTGRPVVVVSDPDAVGSRHANELVGSLVAHAVASVRRVELPGRADATGFLTGLRRGGTHDAGDLRRALWAAVEPVAAWQPVPGKG